jgi:hypothetical protein
MVNPTRWIIEGQALAAGEALRDRGSGARCRATACRVLDEGAG